MSLMKTHLAIEGMSCSSCKLLIEDVCQDIPNVTSCTVDVESGSAEVEHSSAVTGDEIAKAVNEIGKYRVTDIRTE